MAPPVGSNDDNSSQAQPATQPQPQPQPKAKKKAKEGKGAGAKPQLAATGPTKRAAGHDWEDDTQQKHNNEDVEMEEVEVPQADDHEV